MDADTPYRPDQLRYSAGARCRCGSGLAYVRHEHVPAREDARSWSSWFCADVLLGKVPDVPEQHGQHDEFPFFMYEIKSESQPSADGRTTRPPEQGVIWWEIDCTCKVCGEKWSTDRRLPSARSPWEHGPCPKCGEPATKGNGFNNPNIEARARDVLVPPDVPRA